jgi:hypothetical protein
MCVVRFGRNGIERDLLIKKHFGTRKSAQHIHVSAIYATCGRTMFNRLWWVLLGIFCDLF